MIQVYRNKRNNHKYIVIKHYNDGHYMYNQFIIQRDFEYLPEPVKTMVRDRKLDWHPVICPNLKHFVRCHKNEYSDLLHTDYILETDQWYYAENRYHCIYGKQNTSF